MDSQKEITPEHARGEGFNIDNGGLLADGSKLRDDMRLLARAARKGWGVSAEKKAWAVNRLQEIASKRTVDMPTAEGMVPSEYPADQNAIAAIRTLATLDGIDQTDHWNQDKNDRLDSGKLTDRMSVQPQITLRGIPEDVTDVDHPPE